MKLGFEIHSGNEHLLFAAVDAYAVARESREIAELKAQVEGLKTDMQHSRLIESVQVKEANELKAESKYWKDRWEAQNQAHDAEFSSIIAQNAEFSSIIAQNAENKRLKDELGRLRDGIKKGFEKLAEIPYCSVLRTIFDNANGVQNDLESLLSPAPVTEGKEIKTYKCNKCGVVVKADGKPLVCVRHVTFRTSGVCGGAFNEITLNEDYHE